MSKSTASAYRPTEAEALGGAGSERTSDVGPTPSTRARAIDDAALVADLREGRPGAAAAIFDRYGGYVERILARVLGHFDAELEDVLHDVFAQCLEDVGTISDPSRLKPWLAQVAVFTARSVIRRRKRRRWLSYLVPWELPEAPEAPVDHGDRQLAGRLYEALDRLPADERIAFALRFLEDMTVAEAAEVVGVSPATLKRRLVRAREAMRRSLAVDLDSGCFELAEEDG